MVLIACLPKVIISVEALLTPDELCLDPDQKMKLSNMGHLQIFHSLSRVIQKYCFDIEAKPSAFCTMGWLMETYYKLVKKYKYYTEILYPVNKPSIKSTG